MSLQEDLIFSDQFEYEDHIKSISEPPTRLSDSELAELEAEANESDYISEAIVRGLY